MLIEKKMYVLFIKFWSKTIADVICFDTNKLVISLIRFVIGVCLITAESN